MDRTSTQKRIQRAIATLRAAQSTCSRADLIEYADGFEVPFKTFVEELESQHIIPYGTYTEIIWQFRTVDAFRAAVAEARERNAS